MNIENTVSTIFILTILLTVSLSPAVSTIEVCGGTNSNLDDSKVVEVKKLIRHKNNWANETVAFVNDTIRFRITITYHDSDGEGPAYYIRNITIVDILPDGLEYHGNATTQETSKQDNIVIWELGEYFLINENNSPYTLEYDVKIVKGGHLLNIVNVSAIEKCISVWRYVSTSAIVVAIDYRSIDVDLDGNDEYAYDLNENYSDGFEKYVDPDNSSRAIESLDGDDDGKTDHFIDINNNSLPDKYWDPDEGILRNISREDVDYDGTKEWIYDSDGDYKDDKYYDPDDKKIYIYDVFILKVEDDGHGSVEKNPDGEKFLTWKRQQVKLFAIPDKGYIFEYWSGNVPLVNKSDNPLTITMDKNRTIKAHFKQNLSNIITVKIVKPKENWVYKDNIPVRKKIFKTSTEIIGPITIKVIAKSERGIDKVEFYIDDELQHTDDKGFLNIYKWTWLKLDNTNNKTHKIKVIAYDKDGNSNSAEMEVIREIYKPIRDHPLLAIGGIAGFLLLLKNRFKMGEKVEEEVSEPKQVDSTPPELEAPREEPAKKEFKTEESVKEVGLFWYIVGGFAAALLAIIGILYVGRRML